MHAYSHIPVYNRVELRRTIVNRTHGTHKNLYRYIHIYTFPYFYYQGTINNNSIWSYLLWFPVRAQTRGSYVAPHPSQHRDELLHRLRRRLAPVRHPRSDLHRSHGVVPLSRHQARRAVTPLGLLEKPVQSELIPLPVLFRVRHQLLDTRQRGGGGGGGGGGGRASHSEGLARPRLAVGEDGPVKALGHAVSDALYLLVDLSRRLQFLCYLRF